MEKDAMGIKMRKNVRNGRLRRLYWRYANHFSRIREMCRPENRPFGREVLNSYYRHVFGHVIPVKGGNKKAAEAAVAWLMRAQGATPDNGVSYGYFPCHGDKGWGQSYPETTGYIIPSLLDYARRYDAPDVRKSAILMAHWESEIQMDSGAVQGGPVSTLKEQKAAIFNTGMVLQGWTAAFRETGEDVFFESGRQAADFLIADVDSNGHFQTHGNFVSQSRVKTYNVLCAWALYRFGEDSGEAAYKRVAIDNGKAALKEQHDNGWFDNCCLTNPKAPLTHTLGYTLQGLLELGILSGREDFTAAAERGVSPFLNTINTNGFLSGRFDADWKPRVSASCLTGSAQIAIVLYRLFELGGNKRYLDAANHLTDYLKGLQPHDSRDVNLNGAVAGSFPLLGPYMTAGYPNWATKYFLDAVMLQEKLVMS